MKIIFVRHGKDDENYRGGWSNLGLVPEGVEQAKRLAGYLREKKTEYDITNIISSDLPRAKETADIISVELGVPVELEERLREADNGDLAGMPNTEALEKYPGLFWSTLKPDECYPNGESPMQFFTRIKIWFEEFLNECKDAEGNVLVVTHGGVINIIYHLVKGMEWSNSKKSVPVRNCSIHVLDRSQMEFEVEEDVKLITPYTNNIEKYLESSDIIDFTDQTIADLAESIVAKSKDTIDYIKSAYEYVRDHISHSADAVEDLITCSASEVLAAGHGICFAKSHLLAALLRRKGVPCGFCYQKLILDDETAPVLIYHGLNGVYLEEYKKWIRLDARGNKEGVNAQFSVEKEQLAFPIRSDKGEEDSFVVYSEPDAEVLRVLRENRTRTELWDDLPTKLAYKK